MMFFVMLAPRYVILEILVLLLLWAGVHRRASMRRARGEPPLLQLDYLFVFNAIAWAIILALQWVLMTMTTEPDGYNPIWDGFVARALVIYSVPLLTATSMTVWSVCGCRLRGGYWLATVGATALAAIASYAVADWAWSVARS